MYLELIDDDSNSPDNPDELIDRLIENVIVPVGSVIRTSGMGQFGIAETTLRFQAQCRNDFTGEFCNVQVSETPTSRTNAIVSSTVGLLVISIAVLLVIALMAFYIVRKRNQNKLLKKELTGSNRIDNEYAALVSVWVK